MIYQYHCVILGSTERWDCIPEEHQLVSRDDMNMARPPGVAALLSLQVTMMLCHRIADN